MLGVSNGYILPRTKSIVGIEDTTRVTIELAAAASFCEGYVKDYDGNPVKDAFVYAYPYSSVNTSARCRTDSTGHYRIGLTGGTWDLLVSAPGTNEYMLGGSQSVLVPNAGDINVDISIPKADSTISGKVTLNSSGLGGFIVYASGYPYYNSAMTGADGTYSIPVSNTGTYDIEIYLSSTGYYADSQVRYSQGPGATNVDFRIHRVTGGISGKVTDSNTHKPISGAMIEVLNSSSYSYSTVVTDDSGYYRFPLINGSYYLYAYAKGHYSYYDNVAVSGQMVTNDFSMQPSGMITGKITASNGVPLWSAYISLYDAQYNFVGSNYADDDGTYYIDGLNAGQYKAVATCDNYISQWYTNAPDFNGATFINVSAATETPGKDFVLADGGKISGKVTDRTDKPIVGAQVTVYDSYFSWQAYAVTNDSGMYLVGGLGTGNYYVTVSHPDFAVRWYDGKTNSADANKVSVTVGQRTSNINFSLIRASKISGMVTDKYGSAITSASVYLVDTLLNYVGYSYTDQTGMYQATGLNAGVYYACASAYGYGSRWYDNVSTSDSATAIHLSEEEQVSNIDFTLLTGGSISGRILDTKGNPIYWATAFATSVTGSDYSYASADYQGNYTITGLSGTKYIVEAYASQYAQQWYDHKNSYDTADTVQVQSESVTGNINFNLTGVSGIYGYVLKDSDGSGVYGMNVSAFDQNTQKIFYATSSSD
ncbi:MAG: carboxypeptidase-like regulatory domain-containing protein, partial [Bacteroidetes bacterium]|nr:carboxypeptidase-like regulatory domain-containing protein [Bacteroidota bacterium]